MEVSDASRQCALEEENRKLKKLLAEAHLDMVALRDIASEKFWGLRVIRELEAITAVRGKPVTIVSDNGTEMNTNAVLRWVAEHGIDGHYIAPGKPMQSGFVGSLRAFHVLT
jgi:putative transposase